MALTWWGWPGAGVGVAVAIAVTLDHERVALDDTAEPLVVTSAGIARAA